MGGGFHGGGWFQKRWSWLAGWLALGGVAKAGFLLMVWFEQAGLNLVCASLRRGSSEGFRFQGWDVVDGGLAGGSTGCGGGCLKGVG